MEPPPAITAANMLLLLLLPSYRCSNVRPMDAS